MIMGWGVVAGVFGVTDLGEIGFEWASVRTRCSGIYPLLLLRDNTCLNFR